MIVLQMPHYCFKKNQHIINSQKTAHWCGSEFLFKDRIFLFMAEAKRWPFALKKEGTEEMAHKQTHTNIVNLSLTKEQR